jgi:ubiquinone/menaquinone biosynthesis C-methylase UbiE
MVFECATALATAQITLEVQSMASDYWSEHSEDYSNLFQESKEHVLYPAMIDLITRHGAGRLLDYGCGDGRFLSYLPENVEVSVYDRSVEMLALAKELVSDRISRFYQDVDQIPEDDFDVVVVSLVLVCIDNEVEYAQVLRDVHRVLKPGGIGILAVTHPCFRQYAYSDFYTAYSQSRHFNYFNEGEAFGVTMTDDRAGKSISFDDYHWTLSFTINKAIEVGLIIDSVVETRDDASAAKFNSEKSPYLIIAARKS